MSTQSDVSGHSCLGFQTYCRTTIHMMQSLQCWFPPVTTLRWALAVGMVILMIMIMLKSCVCRGGGGGGGWRDEVSNGASSIRGFTDESLHSDAILI